jgi:hypothetical protein
MKLMETYKYLRRVPLTAALLLEKYFFTALGSLRLSKSISSSSSPRTH